MSKPPCPYLHPPGSRCPSCDVGGKYSPLPGRAAIDHERYARYRLLTQELAALGLVVRKSVNTQANVGKTAELVLLELFERSASVPREAPGAGSLDELIAAMWDHPRTYPHVDDTPQGIVVDGIGTLRQWRDNGWWDWGLWAWGGWFTPDAPTELTP